MILSILKGIGIAILILPGIIIFILCLLLFVPIRYQFEGSYHEKPDGEVLVKWVPVLFKVQASFHDDRLEYVIRLFGGVVMTNTDQKLSWIGRRFFRFSEDEEAEPPHRERGRKGKKAASVKDEELSADNEEQSVEPAMPGQENTDGMSQVETDTTSIGKECSEETAPSIPSLRKNEQGENGAESERTSIWEKITERLDAVKKKGQGFIEKAGNIRQKKDQLLKVYHSGRFDRAKKDVLRYIRYIFRILKPGQLEGCIRFGMEDPAATGEILGALAVMLPLYQNYLAIYPDFTGKCLEAELQGKGKLYLFRFAKLAIQIIWNKNLIKVTKKVQTIIEA